MVMNKVVLGFLSYPKITHQGHQVAQEEEGQQNKKRSLVIALITIPMIMILLRTMMYYLKRRVLKSIGIIDNIKRSVYRLLNVIPATDSFNINAPNLSTSWRGWFIYVYKWKDETWVSQTELSGNCCSLGSM
ncbi:hypothetical protein ABKV19_021086 [Rosa sericea]